MPLDAVLKTIIAEGAGEGEEGMYAIASVIVNRAARRKLTLEQVVNQPKQFTGRWRKDLETFVTRQGPAVEAQARRALERATQAPLPGVDHYLTRALYDSPQRPSWARTMGGQRMIGNHIFLDSQPTQKQPTHAGGRMATLDEMRLEGPEVHEQITKQLYRMETNLKAMGLGAMTPEQLRRSYERIKQGIVAVVQSQKRAALGGSGQVPPSPAAPPPMPASSNPPPPVPGTDLPLNTFAEAGFINDASGQATEQGRNRLGIR